MMRSNVDLPQPLGPMMERNSPQATSRLILSRTSRLLPSPTKLWLNSRTETWGPVMARNYQLSVISYQQDTRRTTDKR